MKQIIEVRMSKKGEIFEAIPLFTRFISQDAKMLEYNIGLFTEPQTPIAYAVYHPEVGEKYTFITAEFILKQSELLGEL